MEAEIVCASLVEEIGASDAGYALQEAARHDDTSRGWVWLALMNEHYILHVLLEGHSDQMCMVSELRIPIDNICKSILNDTLVVEARFARLLAVVD